MASITREDSSPSANGVVLSDRTRAHRQVLANLNLYVDSGSDRDQTTTDDEASSREKLSAEDDPDSIVGISMGKAQTRLKSAATPAIEKARALENSGGYFGVETDTLDHDGDDRYWQPSDASPVRSSSPAEQSPSGSVPSPARRSSISRLFGNQSPKQTRPRASSGPTALLQSLKKILPDGPTATLTRFSPNSLSRFSSRSETQPTPTDSEPDISKDSESNESGSTSQQSLDSSLKDVTRKSRNNLSLQGLDGNSLSAETQKRPNAIRRTTSDNSLYLHRVVTGASQFDDTTVYASVADMPNARFKAITDSLQDSAIRFPKLATSLRAPLGLTNSRSEAELTKRNTEANRGSSAHGLENQSAGSVSKPKQSSTPKETKHPILKQALARTAGDLVIMGGYRGSILRSAEQPHQQVWIPVKVGLNLRKVDLEVGLTHEDEEKMTEKIIPSGILSHIGPIDISRRLLKKVRKCSQVRSNQLKVHDWGYDWRLSPHLLARQLIKFLESLESNQPERPTGQRGATVIAHSLGGLITRHAVNQRPDLFSGVVYVGTPQNCVNILGPLRNGDDVLLSSRVLTAQVNFTLRTSFALLPEDGRCFLNKDTGERYDVDFFDPKTWDDLHLSPCINPPLPTTLKRRSIVGSISESITSLAPSLPSLKTNWFTSNESTSSQKVKEKVEEAGENTERAVRSATERLPSPEDAAGQSLEPTMKSTGRPSIATNVTIPKDKAYEYLSRTLSEIKQFKSELSHRKDHQEANLYPPLATIFSQGVPTVYGAKVASREAIRYNDAYDDLAFASGDGVVLASAAQLPVGYRCVKGGRVKSDRGHVGLLGDLEAIGQCLGAVIEGRRRGIGLGPKYKNSHASEIQSVVKK